MVLRVNSSMSAIFLCLTALTTMAAGILRGASAFVPHNIGGSNSHSNNGLGTSSNFLFDQVSNRIVAIDGTLSSTALFKKRSSGPKKDGDKPKAKGFASALRDLQQNSFPYAGTIRPGKQSPQKIVIDESIVKPDYADDGIVSIESIVCVIF